MLSSAQICKICTILGKLWTITQKLKERNRLMTPFLIYFLGCNCLWDSSLYLKTFKIIFLWNPLWSILVCRILKFRRWKLWDQNFVLFNSGSIHIKETKKPNFAFSIELRTKFSDRMVYWESFFSINSKGKIFRANWKTYLYI